MVAFDLPEGASLAEAKAYVLDAVATWGGCYRPPGGYGDDDPGDPFFGGPKNITVALNDKAKPLDK